LPRILRCVRTINLLAEAPLVWGRESLGDTPKPPAGSSHGTPWLWGLGLENHHNSGRVATRIVVIVVSWDVLRVGRKGSGGYVGLYVAVDAVYCFAYGAYVGFFFGDLHFAKGLEGVLDTH
jgi:hypothetical protein